MAVPALSVIALPALAVAEGATAPAPSAGQLGWAWSSTLGKPVCWDGTAWRSHVSIHVGTAPPANPVEGTLWFDTN